VQKCIRGGHIGAKYLTRLVKKGGLSHTSMQVNLLEEQALAQVHKGYKQYNRLKQDKNRRDWWIADLVTAQAEAMQTSKKTIWKKIRATEKIRDNARQMAQAIGTNSQRKGLSTVWGPSHHNPTERQSSKTKGELEIMCLEEAGRRFTQAWHTPFLSSPLVEIFTEYNVYTTAFEQVLQGTFVCPTGTDTMTQRFIAALA